MPLYEYYCSECRQRFEKLVSSLQKEAPCPRCSTLSPKVFSAFSMSGGEKSSPGAGGGGCAPCSSSSCKSC